jgi:hypothetical protein
MEKKIFCGVDFSKDNVSFINKDGVKVILVNNKFYRYGFRIDKYCGGFNEGELVLEKISKEDFFLFCNGGYGVAVLKDFCRGRKTQYEKVELCLL